MKRTLTLLPLALGFIVTVELAVWAGASQALPRNFPPIANPQYVKECGTCHMAFPPQLLPARSWRQVMGSLDHHFGDSAQVDDATRQKLTDYVTANSADLEQNVQSAEVMHSLRPGETPPSISKIPYIAGLHAAVLDPAWGGNPLPKTLSECSVCHYKAETGNYVDRGFKVTDEAFRGRTEGRR
jgi:hypothetical protein